MNWEKVLLWLSITEGITARKVSAILNEFDDPQKLWHAPRERLLETAYISEQLADSMLKERDEAQINAFIKRLSERKISYVTVKDENYPPQLLDIFDPPGVLYYLGELPESGENAGPCVSVIGSRRCSEYGLIVSYKLSEDLAARGVVIISGMAKGIDSSAHRGALSAGGKTVAVLGCGADICYPSENRSLYSQIIKTGCVISEYPPGTKPLPHNFPMRNRIISGLSRAVVVVEAAERSGTLITVDQALEQGREVLAVPGNITSELSAGVNKLLQQGAGIIATGYQDVLNAIGYEEIPVLRAQNPKADLQLAPKEKLVYDCIQFNPQSVPSLASAANLGANEVTALLSMLEIKGYIKKLPGQRYIRK
ncbi:MAG: DNA-processing protein DprA [Clostridiales bacterium]|nr:DNA-processing protein DprA [Clostridiales bacterium]